MAALRKLRHYPTDPQREALYQVERSFTPKPMFNGELTRAQAMRLIKRVRRQYKLVPVKLCYIPREQETVDHGRYDVIYDGETEEVSSVILNINRQHKALNTSVLLHEMAHVICDQYYGMKMADHCPEFVGITIWLYNEYRVIAEDSYRLALRRYEVKHKSMAESSPQAVRAARRC